VDEHQRRVWGQMLTELDAFDEGAIDLGRLVTNLQGLMGAADLHDESLVRDFWNHCAELDMENELRTENWALPGAASDARLRDGIDQYRRWVEGVLAATDDQRT
jgi:hypothetical protein